MTDKLIQAADTFIVAWDSLTTVDLALAEPFVEALRQALAESANSTTDVVESETEEPLTLEEEREAQQQLETHLESVYQRNNQAFLAQARLGQIAIKRLQELADYRLKLLTKMPSEWVGLTDDEIYEANAGGMWVLAKCPTKAFARAIETRLKEKNT